MLWYGISVMNAQPSHVAQVPPLPGDGSTLMQQTNPLFTFIAHFKLLEQASVIFMSSQGGHPEDFEDLESVVCLTMSWP